MKSRIIVDVDDIFERALDNSKTVKPSQGKDDMHEWRFATHCFISRF